MYQITGTIVHSTKDASMCRVEKVIQIPVFFLDENIHGIVSEEHAVQVASQIVLPVQLDYETVTLNLSASKVQ